MPQGSTTITLCFWTDPASQPKPGALTNLIQEANKPRIQESPNGIMQLKILGTERHLLAGLPVRAAASKTDGRQGGQPNTRSLVPFTVIGECFISSAMQLNLSKFTKQPNQWFAGALFVFSLLSSTHPHHVIHAKGRNNILYSHQIQKSNDDSWYTPLRSPAFNDLLGS
jgi:hypothetical protein